MQQTQRAYARVRDARESAPLMILDPGAGAGLAEARVEEVDVLRRAVFWRNVGEAVQKLRKAFARPLARIAGRQRVRLSQAVL